MTMISDFSRPPLSLSVRKLGTLFPSFEKPPPAPSARRLDEWNIEEDDAPIFRYLYQAHQPRRHLEFGTWQGWGTALCLEACAATVWTINLPEGESRSDGSWAYGERVSQATQAVTGIVTANFGEDELGPRTYHRTDAGSYIGRIYREKGLGGRVCQIFCDSRDWDTTNYAADFFDSVLIDGGHVPEVVISDSCKSLEVLRPGGVILWHDFCPLPEIASRFESVKGVTSAIDAIRPALEAQLERLCWIEPSWILIGIKKSRRSLRILDMLKKKPVLTSSLRKKNAIN